MWRGAFVGMTVLECPHRPYGTVDGRPPELVYRCKFQLPGDYMGFVKVPRPNSKVDILLNLADGTVSTSTNTNITSPFIIHTFKAFAISLDGASKVPLEFPKLVFCTAFSNLDTLIRLGAPFDGHEDRETRSLYAIVNFMRGTLSLVKRVDRVDYTNANDVADAIQEEDGHWYKTVQMYTIMVTDQIVCINMNKTTIVV